MFLERDSLGFADDLVILETTCLHSEFLSGRQGQERPIDAEHVKGFGSERRCRL